MWLTQEAHLRAAILEATEVHQLDGLDRAARYFRVSRNFHRVHDTGQGQYRYMPVLDLIHTLGPGPQTAEQAIETVVSFAALLSARYGDRSTLSAASKFLWLKFRDPIIIYDNQARWSLGITTGDYSRDVLAKRGCHIDAGSVFFNVKEAPRRIAFGPPQ